jgi:hypothetical protein
MTTTVNPLSAAAIKNKILNSKGQFIKASWKSNPSPAASFKKEGIILEKRTLAVIQAGVNYSQLSAVKNAIAAGDRNEVGELPWGSWKVIDGVSQFPYLIEHKGVDYIRLTPSQAGNHIPKSTYYVNGEQVTKEEFSRFLTPSEANKLLNPKEEHPLCFTIKSDNILGIDGSCD